MFLCQAFFSKRKRALYLQLLAVLLVSAAVYVNTLWNGFVFDDNIQLLQNPWIRDLANIPEVFKSNVWAFRGSISNYYRPVMHLVYMLGYQLFGLAPWGYHLINIILNAAACLLVFIVTGRLLGDFGMDKGGASRIPLLTAMVFAVHPVHTEAVAWVAGVPDLTYAFFYLLSFYFYMVSRRGASPGRAVFISAASFFIAMLCKEPAITLPAALLGYDHALRREGDGPAGYVKRYYPYAAAIAVYLVIRIAALGGFSPNPPSWKLGPLQVAVNIPPLFGQYLEKLLLPFDLSVSHPFHPITAMPGPAALLGALAAMGFLAALLVSLKKRSIWAMGLLLIAVPLIPALYIPGVGRSVFGERYLYLPVFGFALLLGLSYERFRERASGAGKVMAVSAAALILAYSAGTVTRNTVWADDITLWSDSVKKHPDNPSARDSLGEAYYKKGLVDKAVDEFTAAISLENDNALAHVDLAGAYVKKGMLDKAASECGFAYSHAADNTYVLALVHSNFGAIYAKKGQLDKAVEELGEAISLDPMLAEAHSNLGAVYGMQGRTDEALQHCRAAVEMEPDSLEFHNNLGITYTMTGRSEDALEQFKFVLKENPLYPKAHNNLGITYAGMGRIDMAIGEFEAALKLDPGDGHLRDNLRRAYESRSQGRTQ